MVKSPKERGYRPVMLTDAVYAELENHKNGLGLSSYSSAVLRLLEAKEKPAQQVNADELERAFQFAGISGKPAQKLRDWFGV